MEILPLTLSDASHIAAWNKGTDAAFLQQWAGRGYAYPITELQIQERIMQQASADYELYKITENGEILGTIELMNIARAAQMADIGRFLLHPNMTGKGFGTQALRLFLAYLFSEKQLRVTGLTVFEFNLSAVRCYSKAGFREVNRTERPNGWVAIRMEYTSRAWLHHSVETLMQLHQSGALGGEVMPEDANPNIPKASDENYMYFTLPMALNYQRNSYKLWEAALLTYTDPETSNVFAPAAVVSMDTETLRAKLLKHKLALQPNRHPDIWLRLCRTFQSGFGGSVKRIFAANDYTIVKIKSYMTANKKDFPYLSGTKIMNYWLYVMTQYTDAAFADTENISIAPDTHVLQASVKLGLIRPEALDHPHIRETVSELWNEALAGTQWRPVDVHTPLWLWSRSGFQAEV